VRACLWWSTGAGKKAHDGISKGKAGRRRGQHSSTAVQLCVKMVNQMAHEEHNSYSQQQLYYDGPCRPGTKHVVYRGVRSANHSNTALQCRVCDGGGSSWECLLYELLDKEQLIELYATEACSLSKLAHPVVQDGVRVHPEMKRWDVVTAAPSGLLIEMQGEGHSSRLVSKANNTDSSMAKRQRRDWLYAQTAIGQGWSVLWLWVDEHITSRSAQAAIWAAQLTRAVAHVKAKGAPQLFVA
jgi:hypothetical protein